MSNKLIPFDAATFDPKPKYSLFWENIPVDFVEIKHGGNYPVVVTDRRDGEYYSFTIDGRKDFKQPVSLFMEPIEPEGEEKSNWQDLYNEVQAKYATQYKINEALEKERDELKADRDNWKQCHTAEVKNADNWNEKCCQAEDQAALWEKRYNELMAISHKQPAPPATIPFSLEKYKEGYPCQTTNGNLVSGISELKRSDGTILLVGLVDDCLCKWDICGKYLSGEIGDEEGGDFAYYLRLIPPAPVEELWYKNFYPMHSELRHLNIDEGQKYLLLKKTGNEFTSVSIQTL